MQNRASEMKAAAIRVVESEIRAAELGESRAVDRLIHLRDRLQAIVLPIDLRSPSDIFPEMLTDPADYAASMPAQANNGAWKQLLAYCPDDLRAKPSPAPDEPPRLLPSRDLLPV